MNPPAHPPRRWRPTPLIVFSLALHAAIPLLWLLYPSAWPWWLLALLLDHVWLTLAGLWPRSRSLGPNWVRLPHADGCIAITIDDGPDPLVTPQVLDLLDRFGARASFFCIGEQARRHPELCREIVRRGHAVENHSQHHFHHFSLFGPGRIAQEVGDGQNTLTAITGQRPLFFRPTAGLRNPFLEPVLARHGMHLASWTRRGYDTRNRNADDVLRRLTRELAAGDILLLHDGNAARAGSGHPVILSVLPRLLDAVAAAGLRSVTLRAALSSGAESQAR
jgi:peptidoglycan-N-acetylglucosamine deacetylase